MKTYICEDCNKIFSQKSTYDNHKNRKTKCTEKEYKKISKYICEDCDKIFSQKSNFEAHKNKKNKCAKKEKNINDKIVNLEAKLEEQNKLILLLLEKITNNNGNGNNNGNINTNTTNSNNTTTNNKNFNNYNYVINNYKDALNLEDCFNDKKITKDMINECSNMFYNDGAIFLIKKMCNINEAERPLHCTDASRRNYIVKTKNEWKTDIGGSEIKETILPVVDKVYKDIYKERYRKDKDDKKYIDNIENLLTKNQDRRFGKMMDGTATCFLLKK